jgi:hypothetical protein
MALECWDQATCDLCVHLLSEDWGRMYGQPDRLPTLIGDARVVEGRIGYTDGMPCHDPCQESNRAGPYTHRLDAVQCY